MKIKLLTLFAVLGVSTMNFVACSSGEDTQNTEEPALEAEPEEEEDAGLDGEEE